jgi:predicted dehydrogenase
MPDSDPVRVGVLGLGWAAGAHIETFASVDGADVVAACSRRDLDPEALEREYGRPIEPYQDYDAMLAEDSIDVVDVCTPSHLHAEHAIAAAEAGKDLVLEKPIALTWEDACRVREAVRANDVSVCVCFEVRFSEQAETLNSAIEEDLLGELHYAEVDYNHSIGPSSGQFEWNVKEEGGGSSLLTAGCHALDLLRLYMDDAPVSEVTSYSTSTANEDFEPYEYDTTSVTVLHFADGRIGKVASSIDCLQPYYFRMHLMGSQGTALDDKFYSERIDGLDSDRWSEFGTSLVDSGDVAHHPYRPQFQAFVDSLGTDEPMPRTDFETAFESHRVIFAANRSAEEGRPVSLSEFDVGGQDGR